MKKCKVAIVGLGHQAIDDHIPAVLKSPYHELSSVCDIDEEQVNKISLKYNVSGFSSSNDLLNSHKPDIVILSLPHSEYLEIIKTFAIQGVHIIKEKPFAISIKEALQIDSLIKRNNIFLGLTLQRRFNPIYVAFNQLRHRIGKIYLIDGIYGFNIDRLDVGWRASNNYSGGGALMDMGYHFIDLLVWYMGIPDTITARFTRGNRDNHEYDVEDTASLMFEYFNDRYSEKTLGRFLISRVYPRKEEYLIFYGTRGNIKIEKDKITRSNINGDIIDILERKDGGSSASFDQLIYFTKIILGDTYEKYTYKEHFKHVSIISSAYESDRINSSIKPMKYYSTLMQEASV